MDSIVIFVDTHMHLGMNKNNQWFFIFLVLVGASIKIVLKIMFMDS